MSAPAWLTAALARCCVCCPGCGPLLFSARFGPVDPDGPDGPWDWGTVAHHAPHGCPVLGDAAAMAELSGAIDAELAIYIMLADYGEPATLHTDIEVPA